MLLVVVLVISFSGKLYSQAKHTIKTDFDPDKYFATNTPEEDVLASGIADLLPASAKTDANIIPSALFAKPDFTNQNVNGQLVLLQDINYKQPFFFDQNDKIGMLFSESAGGITVFLTKEKGGLLQKSLFTSYDDTHYLMGKKLCVLPEDVHGAFISKITGISLKGGLLGLRTPPTFPSGVTIDNLAKYYEVNNLELRSNGDSYSRKIANVDGTAVELVYSPISFLAGYTNAQLTPINEELIIPETLSLSYTGGLLVWVKGNTVCIIDRGFTTHGLQYDASKNKITGRGKMSDLLLQTLLKKGLVKRI